MGVFLYKRGRRLQKTKSKMAQEIKAYKNSGGAAEAYDVDRKEAQSPDLPGEYEKGEKEKLYFVRNEKGMFDLQTYLEPPPKYWGVRVLGPLTRLFF